MVINGLMPDIYKYDGNMDNILLSNDIKITPGVDQWVVLMIY